MSNTAVITFCRARLLHLLCCVLLSSISLNVAIGSVAQADTAITPTTGAGDLGTHILPPSGNVYGIIDGTPAGNNLYHSFAQFNVGTGDVAQFQTSTLIPDAAMHNILGRITDANPSVIFGTIDSAAYYPSANLFLMNPYGFLFGPNAMVNVGGMAAFTTADYLRLTDNVRFEAIPGPHDALLSAFPVAAFGFLGSNPAAIAVQGSQLTVANGTGLSLVGGNHGFSYIDPDTGNPASVPDGITVTGGSLSAANGEINLVSVASPGEILLPGLELGPNVNGDSFTSLGAVSISQGGLVDASGGPGGTVRIRSGQFVLDGSFLFSNTTGDVDGASTAVHIDAQDSAIVRNASAIVSFSDGAGRSGDIEITAGTLSVLDGSAIFSGSFGSAPASNILITASNSVSLTGTDPFGSGVGSTITSDSVDFCGCTEPSGSVSITASSLTLDDQAIIQTRASGDRRAGDITLDLGNLNVRNGSAVQTSGSEIALSGTIRVTAAETIALSGQFDSDTPSRILNVNEGLAGTGAIVLETGSLSLEGGARIRNESLASLGGEQAPTKITIVATDNVNLSGGSNIRVLNVSSNVGGIDISGRSITLTDQSVIRTVTFGDGNAGPINLTASDLSILNGSTVDSSTTDNAGLGGNIAINLTGNLALTGQSIGESGEVISSNISSRTTGSGDGGRITILANSTVISDGALINTSTALGTGNAGSVTIQGLASPSQSLLISDPGSGIFTDTQGTGAGGNIAIESNQVQLTDQATLSANTTGPSRAGDITLVAEDIALAGFSAIMTNTFGAGDAGSIRLTAPSVEIANSAISALTLAEGNAGNILLEVSSLTLTDEGNVLASTEGAGFGGDITIRGLSGPGSHAENVILTGLSTLDTTTLLENGPAGNVTIDTARLTVADESQITSSSQQGSGPAGNVLLDATESVTVSGGFIFSASLFGSTGNGGQVRLTTPTLTVQDGPSGFGGVISTSTSAAGRAGNVTINASNVSLSNGGQVASNSSLLGVDPPTGSGGIVTVQGLQGSGSRANLVTINGDDSFGNQSGIFTNTEGTGAGGNIFVNADSVTLQNGGTLSAKTSGPEITATGGTITIEGNTVQLNSGGTITAQSTGSGNAGNVTIQGLASPAESVLISGIDENFNSSGIFTNTQGTGAGGNITVHADQIALQSGAVITSSTSGAGEGGTVSLNASESISLVNSSIASNSETDPGTPIAGNGGQLHLSAPSITLEQGSALLAQTTGSGHAGTIDLNTNHLSLADESVVQTSTQGPSPAGSITVQGLGGSGTKAQTVSLASGGSLSSISNGNDEFEGGAAGNILMETQTLSLSGGSQITTSSNFSSGDAGTITINAGEEVQLSQGILASRSTSVVPDEFVNDVVIGNAGSIIVSAPTVTLTNHSLITTTTDSRYTGDPSKGNAGSVTVNATHLSLTEGSQLTSSSIIDDSGQSPVGNAGNVTVQGLASPASSVLIDGAGSGVFTDTQGAGAGGNIFVNANSVTLQNGGTLSAKTSGTDATAAGGSITVDANQVQLNSGATITANSAGTADAGSIDITATNGLTMQNSAITTEAGQGAGGGDIKVTTAPSASVLLENSRIIASVADGHGGGGNISIDPQYVILQNSQILAQAAQGQGGAITITANLFLQDATSIVNADSGSGLHGTVTIQSPNAPASGKIQPLGKSPLLATSLLNQHCAALAGGEFSSFTVAGRDSLPTEPGSWLASPLHAAGAGEGLGVRGKGLGTDEGLGVRGEALEGETALLSLRQIAPAGFLTQAFAADWSAGCQS